MATFRLSRRAEADLMDIGAYIYAIAAQSAEGRQLFELDASLHCKYIVGGGPCFALSGTTAKMP